MDTDYTLASDLDSGGAVESSPPVSHTAVRTTDLDATSYATDKASNHHYLAVYASLLGDRRMDELALLELGVFQAGSLYMWRDYLPNSTIVGLDISPVEIDDESGRVHVVQGEQQDGEFLDQIGERYAPHGFDVIIDDASHVGEFTRLSFWHLFEHHLKPGGIYVIEDWGCGYWNSYPDGKPFTPSAVKASLRERFFSKLQHHPLLAKTPGVKRIAGWARYHLVRRRFPSHDCGIVGFVKQLIDECGMGDITHPEYGSGQAIPSRFESMEVRHGQVIIRKAMSCLPD